MVEAKRCTVSCQEIAPYELVTGLLNVPVSHPGCKRDHGGGFELVACQRAKRGHRTSGRPQAIEPCGEKRVERRWERVTRVLADVFDELLEEEWISAGGSRNRPGLGSVEGSVGDLLEESLARGRGERPK